MQICNIIAARNPLAVDTCVLSLPEGINLCLDTCSSPPDYNMKHLQCPFCIHIPYADCISAAKEIAEAIRTYNKPVLMVASTDMTHYESRKSASHKDHLALDHILSLDPEGLYNTVIGQRISMCGIMPTTIVLAAALDLGATQAELIRYTDSGETSGDIQQVVGYAGCVIS